MIMQTTPRIKCRHRSLLGRATLTGIEIAKVLIIVLQNKTDVTSLYA
jgi:hypothetical protein